VIFACLYAQYRSREQYLQHIRRVKHKNCGLAVEEFHRSFGQLTEVLFLLKLRVLGVQLAFLQVLAMDSGRIVYICNNARGCKLNKLNFELMTCSLPFLE
jgi:hypothetical protein